MTLKDVLDILEQNLTPKEFEEFFTSIDMDDSCPKSDKKWAYDNIKADGYRIVECSGSEGFYPLADYGWDGGDSIMGRHWNMVEVVPSVDLFGGPMASIVKKEDHSLPGFQISNYSGDGSYQITVYN
jgi:hypothetical protein